MNLQMRNNQKIRNIFAEIITVLCQSPKDMASMLLKLIKKPITILDNYQTGLRHLIQHMVTRFFRKEDPKEIYIATNELAYHLSEHSKNLVDACFWIEWIIEFENISKKYKKKIECERRENIPVDQKYQKETIWIVWDILLKNVETKPEMTKKIVNSLLYIVCIIVPVVKEDDI